MSAVLDTARDHTPVDFLTTALVSTRLDALVEQLDAVVLPTREGHPQQCWAALLHVCAALGFEVATGEDTRLGGARVRRVDHTLADIIAEHRRPGILGFCAHSLRLVWVAPLRLDGVFAEHRRWTLAHEAGHAALGHFRPQGENVPLVVAAEDALDELEAEAVEHLLRRAWGDVDWSDALRHLHIERLDLLTATEWAQVGPRAVAAARHMLALDGTHTAASAATFEAVA